MHTGDGSNGHVGSSDDALTTETVYHAEGLVDLHVSGEIDAATSDKLDEALQDAVSRARELRLDLSGVSFMDSSGLNALVAARHACEARQVRFFLADDNANVRHLLELAGLAELFTREPPPT